MRSRKFDGLLDKQVKLNLTDEQHEQLLKAAAAVGKNINEYLRPAVLKKVEEDLIKFRRKKAA